MKTFDEQWKPIDGFDGLYEISSLGRVKSLKFGKEKIMKQTKTKNGYLLVQLCKGGKVNGFLVHRLVAIAFIQNHEGFEQVNHKDENKSNNCISNLEFCDCKYNINYGSHNEKSAASRSKAVEASRFSDFREICLRFCSTQEAGRNGYAQQAVSSCCRGCFHYEGNNRYKNLYWRYAC